MSMKTGEALTEETLTPRQPVSPHVVHWTPELVMRFWSWFGKWPSFEEQYFSRSASTGIIAAVECVASLAGRRMLDYGCGSGHLIDALLARGGRCQGVEFSPASCETVAGRFSGRAGFLGVVDGRALPLAVADGSIEVVFCIETIEHLLEEQLVTTFAEMRRMLAPGGLIVVTTPNSEDLRANEVLCPECGCVFHRWQHMRAFSSQTLAAFMERIGFTTVRCGGAVFEPGWAGQALRGKLYRAIALAARTGRRVVGRLLGRPQAAPPYLLYIGRMT